MMKEFRLRLRIAATLAACLVGAATLAGCGETTEGVDIPPEGSFNPSESSPIAHVNAENESQHMDQVDIAAEEGGY